MTLEEENPFECMRMHAQEAEKSAQRNRMADKETMR